MMTVVLCCNTAFAIVNFRAGLIRELRERGHRVAAIAPFDAVYSPTLQELGAECFDWPLSGRATKPWSEVAAVIRLISIYRRIEPDLVFNYTIKPVIYGSIAARWTRIHCVAVVTGLGYAFLNDGIVARIARWLYARTLIWSREVWFLNPDDIQTFRARRLAVGVPVRQLPGEGIDLAQFARAPLPASDAPGDCSFLFIGRLLRDKGVMELVEAFSTVRQRYPAARLRLLGASDSDNPSAIAGTVLAGWVARGEVEYLGTTTDVRPFIAQADCVVLPSYREGVPRSLLEGAAMARPIVMTDVPGCRDVVEDQTTGFLCAARDVSGLTSAMLRMVEAGPAVRRTMGEAARRLVEERFEERIVIRRYLDYLDALNPHRGVSASATGRRAC